MTYIASTASSGAALRAAIAELRKQLSESQRELSTGRSADLALAIGSEVGRDFSLGVGLQDIEAIVATNKIVTARLDVTQAALEELASNAENLMATLISARNDGGNPATIRGQAQISLGNLISTLNASDGDSFVFGGIANESPPIADFFADPPPASRQAFDAAFANAFGMPPSSPAVASITATQMQAFLAGPVSTLFSPANWATDWSSASDRPVRSRISISQTIETSATANDPALQKLAMGYTILSEAPIGQLDRSAYQVAIETAARYLDEGISGLTQTRARVGVMQSSVENATRTMTIQQGLLKDEIGSLENVDPAEAATKVSNLMTQIETAYLLTSRILQLSLAKYL